jgi:hypothetical protein
MMADVSRIIQANPEDKLYLLQFPDPFPAFVPDPARSFLKDVDVEDLKPKSELLGDAQAEPESASKDKDKAKKGVSFADKDKDAPEVVVKKEDDKEKKAKEAKLKALMAKEKARKPEGRIGTMVVMKSGKVKMVLGDGIVMDVSSVRTRDASDHGRVIAKPFCSCVDRSRPAFRRRLCSNWFIWTVTSETRRFWGKSTRAS